MFDQSLFERNRVCLIAWAVKLNREIMDRKIIFLTLLLACIDGERTDCSPFIIHRSDLEFGYIKIGLTRIST